MLLDADHQNDFPSEWIWRALRGLGAGNNPCRNVACSWLLGTVASLTGTIANAQGLVGVSLLIHGRAGVPLAYNCQYQTFAGAFRVPHAWAPGAHQLRVRVSDSRGPGTELVTAFTVTAASPIQSAPPVKDVHPQPSAKDLARSLPQIRVVAMGSRFVIFDMRDSHVYKTP